MATKLNCFGNCYGHNKWKKSAKKTSKIVLSSQEKSKEKNWGFQICLQHNQIWSQFVVATGKMKNICKRTNRRTHTS